MQDDRSPVPGDEDNLTAASEIAWLVGHVPGLERARARVIVEGEDLRWEVAVDGGTFRLERLEPGRYRVEVRAERLVIARRIDVVPGPNAITLRVHADVAMRVVGPPAPGAEIIRLPVAAH